MEMSQSKKILGTYKWQLQTDNRLLLSHVSRHVFPKAAEYSSLHLMVFFFYFIPFT